jgi:hypothetical protein
MRDRLPLQRIGDHDPLHDPLHERRENPQDHGGAGRFNDHFVGRMQLPAQPFKGGPGHVDPAEAAEPAVLPNHHRAEGSLDIDANPPPHQRLPSDPMQERWATPRLRIRASRRNRASRRGGQRLTRARGSSGESACPPLRAPGASVPDGGAIRRKLVTRSRVFGAGSLIPVTNASEALNAKLRRAVRTRGHFPTDQAAIKLLFLVLRQVAQTGKMPPREWCEAKTQFAIMFDDRFVQA